MFLYTEILRGLQIKPRMYFRPPLFSALCNYVHGCTDALLRVAPEHTILAELSGFETWLSKRFELPPPPYCGHWSKIVSDREEGDGERVQLFAELFLAYRAGRATSYTDEAQIRSIR